MEGKILNSAVNRRVNGAGNGIKGSMLKVLGMEG
jgi:hypothetical protein